MLTRNDTNPRLQRRRPRLGTRWTPQLDAIIRMLWWRGKSDLEISRHDKFVAAGISKCAVVGRRCRMLDCERDPSLPKEALRRGRNAARAGMVKRLYPERRGGKLTKPNRPVRAVSPPRRVMVEPAGGVYAGLKTFFELADGDCRYMTDAEHFCARPAVTILHASHGMANRSWCKHHATQVFDFTRTDKRI